MNYNDSNHGTGAPVGQPQIFDQRALDERKALRWAGRLNPPIKGPRGWIMRSVPFGPPRGDWDTEEFRADELKWFGAEPSLLPPPQKSSLGEEP